MSPRTKAPPLSQDAASLSPMEIFDHFFGGEESKLGQDRVSHRRIQDIRPSPENDRLYKPVDPSSPDVIALAKSIQQHGLKEPIVVTKDDWILSGHRRHAACKLAGLEIIPCRVEPIRRTDDIDAFFVLLREYNRQREKTRSEKLREELVTVNPESAYDALVEHRRKASAIDMKPLRIDGDGKRCKITGAKMPFLAAIKRVLAEREEFLPLSDRAIHYALLNDPPLIHASKPESRYANTKQAYKSLTELLTRARLEGYIPMAAIADETRAVSDWNGYTDSRDFMRAEMKSFMDGYWRNLMQSQENHIEIIGEKNTVAPILRPIAGRFCMPMTTGRGFCSLPPRAAMHKRFKNSGKAKLVLLIVSDFDPEGEEIAHSFARSMRDDFGIRQIHPIKVALTKEHVTAFKLIPDAQAKTGSTNYRKFVRKHGTNVFELEAIPPADLQRLLEQAIDSVIDVDAFNAEVDTLKEDSAFLEGVRRTVCSIMKDIGFDDKNDAN